LTYADSFLYVSAIAYLAAFTLPKPTLRNVSLWKEKFGFLACSILLLGNLTFNIRILWVLMCVFWTFSAVMSFLGYEQWNVLWRKDVSDAAQMFMSAWNLAIAACCMMKFLINV
jgi:hypothetical protein